MLNTCSVCLRPCMQAKAAQEAAVRELEAVRTQMSTATAEHTAAEKLIAQLREENTKL